ncbi:unnamed protein product [Chironomus riparius]|uniref:Aminopeptidase N-like N-terminal domain-containing protein n=1 Tax=Chironomus riparius TaxID=315576 RepID=A0A9N9RZD0_9DIPT|nr:unnamed protein product [Chironomus riparius]
MFGFILAAINADLNRRLDEKNHQSDTTSAVTDPITTPSTNEVNSTTTTTTTTTTVSPLHTTADEKTTVAQEDSGAKTNNHGRKHLQTGHFTGNVKIDLAISSSIYEFAIHTHLLNISSVKFTLPGSNVEVESYEHHAKLEQLKIYLTNSVGPTNNSTLEIDFSGSLNDKIVGFYRSAYKDNEGNASERAEDDDEHLHK